jgi:phenylacetate-CoA ligase
MRRTLVRMKKCTGRSDDMMIIRGVNIFPSTIESTLLDISETRPHYLIIIDRVNNLDVLQVLVEVDQQFFLDRIGQLGVSVDVKLRQKIKSWTDALESTLGISS